MKPIVEQHSVKVELIYMLYDSPDCKVYALETDVKRPHVVAMENGRLKLAIYPEFVVGCNGQESEPTTVLLHEIGNRFYTTTIESARYTTIVTFVVYPEETNNIYDSESQGDQ